MIKRLINLGVLRQKYRMAVDSAETTLEPAIRRIMLEGANKYAIEYNNEKMWFHRPLKQYLLPQGVECYLVRGLNE